MTIPDIGSAQAFARLAFLEGTPPDVLARFTGQARWIDAAPERTVVGFDDDTTDVFFIVQGSLRVLLRTADGERTQILGDFVAGDIVGEMAAIDGAHRSAQVEALVRTRLCVLSAKDFLDLAFASPDVGLRLMRLLTSRIRGLNRRLIEHTALPTRLRLGAELLRLGRPRPDGTRAVSPPPTQEELAARIGARRETVSRELAALTRAGLVHRTRSALVMDDPAKLRAVVESGLDQPLEGLS